MPLNDKSIMLGRYPVFAHTMLRVKDPVKSGLFYEKLLGMKLLTRFDFPNLAFSLFFYASPEIEIPKDLRSQTERAKWLWNLRFPTLELTHNWGTERNPDFHYHNGNEDPKGFVHLAFVVDDVTVAIEELKSQGVPVLQYPHHSEIGKVAYILDPDGYWIQIISTETGTKKLFSRTKDLDSIRRYRLLAETRVRIKDPLASKEFYERGLGMTLLKQVEIPKSRLTLYYYGYTDYTAYDHLRGDMIEIDNFLIPRLVLQYSWDSESNLTLSYHNGNSEPKGFGHIALTVEDIYGSCDRMQKAGYKVIRKPGPFQDVGEISFISDPDGYWIELIQRSSPSPRNSAL